MKPSKSYTVPIFSGIENSETTTRWINCFKEAMWCNLEKWDPIENHEGYYLKGKVWEDVNIIKKQSHIAGEHIMVCYDEKDLSVENILKTLSAIKGRLMVDIVRARIAKIECSMTPLIKHTIIDASKRLKRYGKKRPIIACFDEYGNRLFDEIYIGTDRGITLKIVDPEKYGKHYLELKGTESLSTRDNVYTSHLDSEDLPF